MDMPGKAGEGVREETETSRGKGGTMEEAKSGECAGAAKKKGSGNATIGKSKTMSQTRILEVYNILKDAMMRTEDGKEVDNKFCPQFMNLLHQWHDMLPHVLNYREGMVKRLNGITPSSTGRYSLLHWCAVYGKAEACACLLLKGASPNVINAYSQTPLHIATMYGRVDVACILLEAGINRKKVDIYGKTAKDWCWKLRLQKFLAKPIKVQSRKMVKRFMGLMHTKKHNDAKMLMANDQGTQVELPITGKLSTWTEEDSDSGYETAESH